LDCEEYLATVKWGKGYCCRKCRHTKYQVRKDFSRTCNICSNTESPTSGTLFQRMKFGLRKAFFICLEMSATTKDMSASQMSVCYGVLENTARLFIYKVREAMKRTVYVDEFTVSTVHNPQILFSIISLNER